MQTATLDTAGKPNRTVAQTEQRSIFQNAAKAFDLIHKYRTPPDPKTYALWYAYAAGSNAKLVERVDGVISSTGGLTDFDIATISQELLEQTPVESARHNIGQAIEKEIESVLDIIQQSVKNSDSYHASLSEAGKQLPHAVNGEELTVLVATLVEENKRMAATAQELNQGLKDSQNQIANLNKELEDIQTQCLRDPLTAISNRRAFDQRLAEALDDAARNGNKLCLAMADIDHFKKVNDTYGHQVGDAVLQMFAGIIDNNIKGQDMVARYGGEEFAIILPETDLFAAYNLLVKIKYALKSAELKIEGSDRVISDITASFGVTRYEPGMSVRDLVEQADKFLYEAKHAGRDRVKAKGF